MTHEQLRAHALLHGFGDVPEWMLVLAGQWLLSCPVDTNQALAEFRAAWRAAGEPVSAKEAGLLGGTLWRRARRHAELVP